MRNRLQDRAGIEAAEALIPAAIRDSKVLPFFFIKIEMVSSHFTFFAIS